MTWITKLSAIAIKNKVFYVGSVARRSEHYVEIGRKIFALFLHKSVDKILKT